MQDNQGIVGSHVTAILKELEMLLLSILFTIVFLIFAYALRSDKGQNTAHARGSRQDQLRTAQTVSSQTNSKAVPMQ